LITILIFNPIVIAMPYLYLKQTSSWGFGRRAPPLPWPCRAAQYTPAVIACLSMSHPCLTCGACCASFRVDFSVHESQEHGGRVPAGLVEEVTETTCRMRGTDWARPRCAALVGQVGTQAHCGIYEWRPSPCREFAAGSDACNRVRQRHGLPALDSGLL